MKTILVTGPIGGGKSTVCRYLAEKGYPVYDCDSRCKALYEEVPGLKGRIEGELGIAFEDLRIIFSDESLRLRLESIVYPLLLEDILRWRDSQSSPLVFIESAVALSKPVFDGLFDEVLLIEAPLEDRMQRHPGAADRDAIQTYDRSRTDYCIMNDSTLESLYSKIDSYENRSLKNSFRVR